MPRISSRHGFTLLEVLLAVAILSLIGTLIFSSFQNITNASVQIEDSMNSLHHGEIILEQLVTSLRSSVFFEQNADKYGYIHEDDDTQDLLSWVSGTMAFIPPRFPTQQGLHRIYLSVDEIDGVEGLYVAAYPHLVDPENDDEVEKVDPWLVSSKVRGIDFRFYNVNEQDWDDEWERKNQLPQFIELSLYLENDDPEEEDIKLMRSIHVPLGKLSRDTRRGRRGTQPDAEGNAPSNPNSRNPESERQEANQRSQPNISLPAAPSIGGGQ